MFPGGIRKIPSWLYLKMSIIYSNKGLTLTELLLAAAILAFVLCGIVALFVNCSFLNEANRNLTVAMTHAQYIMEEIRDSDFINLETSITDGNWDWNEAEIVSHNLVALSDEAIDTNVFQVGNPLGVSVKIDWKDRNTRDRHTELETLLTDY